MLTSFSDQTWPGLDLQMTGLLQIFNYFLWGKVCSIFVLLYSEILRNVSTPYTHSVILLVHTTSEDGTHRGSETSAHKIQMLVNCPRERIQQGFIT
jgi:hypothetical protein